MCLVAPLEASKGASIGAGTAGVSCVTTAVKRLH